MQHLLHCCPLSCSSWMLRQIERQSHVGISDRHYLLWDGGVCRFNVTVGPEEPDTPRCYKWPGEAAASSLTLVYTGPMWCVCVRVGVCVCVWLWVESCNVCTRELGLSGLDRHSAGVRVEQHNWDTQQWWLWWDDIAKGWQYYRKNDQKLIYKSIPVYQCVCMIVYPQSEDCLDLFRI